MVDSKDFKILTFEEVEELKSERASLLNRIQAARRKLALERKVRDAAQSLNRLYSTKKKDGETSPGGSPMSPRRMRKSILGRQSSSSDVLDKTDDEYLASSRRCDELSQELSSLEQRLEEVQKSILEHTSGILQVTHKGLRKDLRREDLPRSPESMASLNQRSTLPVDSLDEFDERSQYKGAEFFDDAGSRKDQQLLGQAEQELDAVNNRIRRMVLQADPNQNMMPPPKSARGHKSGASVQAHLDYLTQALESIEAAQTRTVQDAQRSVYDSEDQMEDINSRLHDMLQKTTTAGQSPVDIGPDSRGKSLTSQLSFSTMVLERLDQRIEQLVEQKDILSRQVQQQRNLNSKSDAQRDAQIVKLTSDLAQAQKRISTQEKEAKSATDQMHLMMEQLDSTKQEGVLLDQKRQSEDRKLLQAEKDAKKKAEDTLKAERATKKKVDEALKQAQGALQAEKASRKRADDSLKQLQKTLQTEREAKKKADESVNKLQGTLKQGNDAQKQINENIASLQAALQTERDHKMNAEEKVEQLQKSLQLEKDGTRSADDTLTQLQGSLQSERENAKKLQEQVSQAQDDLDEAKIDKAQAEAEAEKSKKEVKEMEENWVKAQTELTIVRAELDGAYGTRAQRAADVTMNPEVKKEMDVLHEANKALEKEISELKAKGAADGDAAALKKELKETIDDYEQMTKSSIEAEKDRERLEVTIDGLRERNESLEVLLSDEKVRWLGMKSPGHGGNNSTELTSTMVLKTEFKKMMRDTRAENQKSLRVSFPGLIETQD